MPRPSFRAAPVRVRVPASSANLGPGFDAVGLALALYDDVVVRVADEGLYVDVAGEGADKVPRTGRHLVVRALRAGFDALGGQPRGLEVVCANRIPHARGLGSSAAAIVAGVVAARALALGGEETLDDAAVLGLAAELEGHPDNAAACLLGGLTVAWTDEAGSVGLAGRAGAGQPATGQAATGQATTGQVAAGHAGPADAGQAAGHATPGQVPPGSSAPGQAGAGQAAPGQVPAGSSAPGQAGAGQARPGQAAAGHAAPGQVPPGSSAPGQAGAGQSGRAGPAGAGPPGRAGVGQGDGPGPAGPGRAGQGGVGQSGVGQPGARQPGAGRAGPEAGPGRWARAVRLEPSPSLCPVIFVPVSTGSTTRARKLLPEAVTHADAARNAGRAALLVHALTSPDAGPALLLAATEDRLHQQYRAPAMPRSAALVDALRRAGVPAVVSGAGPAVLAFATHGIDLSGYAPRGWTTEPVTVDLAGAAVLPLAG